MGQTSLATSASTISNSAAQPQRERCPHTDSTFVRTAERTALDYFIQPLRAQLRRAMREP